METGRGKETGCEKRVLTDTENGAMKPRFDFECTTPNDSQVFVFESTEGDAIYSL